MKDFFTSLSSDMTMSILYKDKKVSFPVKDILTRKKESDKNGIMYYLEEYINSKDDAFKERLMDAYMTSYYELDDLTMIPSLFPLNYNVFYRILDLFDIDDISKFLKGKVKIPIEFKDTYIEENDGMLNRVQTYTKQDYFELTVLSTVLRSVTPILGKYWYCKSGYIEINHREINFIPIFNRYTRISSLPAYVKLQDFTVKVFEKEGNKTENDMVRNIISGIPRDETVNWCFATFLFREIMGTSTLDDVFEKNIVTKVFNSVKSKLNKDTKNTPVSEKKPIDSYGDTEKDESLAESYRITTVIIPGFIVELNWVVSNPKRIAYQFMSNSKIDEKVLDDALSFISLQDDFIISRFQIALIGWVLHEDVLDCRSGKYIKLDGLKNMMAVSFAYLWTKGFKELALIVLSKTTEEDFYSSVTNRSKITPELKADLDKFYPLSKNKLTRVGIDELGIAEVAINDLADGLYKEQFTTFASREYIEQALGNRSPIIVLSSELKIQLANLLLVINKE